MLFNRRLQLLRAAMRPPADLALGRTREPALHLAAGVQDRVDLEVRRHPRANDLQELAELDRPMPRVAVADHLAGRDVQCGRAVPSAIVRPEFRQTRSHRQGLLGAAQGSDSRLFVDAQHPARSGGARTAPRFRTEPLAYLQIGTCL